MHAGDDRRVSVDYVRGRLSCTCRSGTLFSSFRHIRRMHLEAGVRRKQTWQLPLLSTQLFFCFTAGQQQHYCPCRPLLHFEETDVGYTPSTTLNAYTLKPRARVLMAEAPPQDCRLRFTGAFLLAELVEERHHGVLAARQASAHHGAQPGNHRQAAVVDLHARIIRCNTLSYIEHSTRHGQTRERTHSGTSHRARQAHR